MYSYHENWMRAVEYCVKNPCLSVVEIQISVSSGSKVLDDAALKIVKLAAPYEPLPSEIRKKYDRLNITRSIVFHKENGRAAFYTN